jgi:hypothetical protein
LVQKGGVTASGTTPFLVCTLNPPDYAYGQKDLLAVHEVRLR